MKASIDKIISLNETYWASFMYSHLEVTPNYLFATTPEVIELKDLSYAVNSMRRVRSSELAGMEARFFERGLPPAIWVDPGTPSSLVSKLEANGYSEMASEEEVWREFNLEVKLERAGTAAAKTPMEVFHISPKETPEEFGMFLSVVQKCYDMPVAMVAQIRRRLLYPHEAVRHALLLATVNGKPAAVVCLGIIGDRAFFSLRGTVPEFRRLGIMNVLEIERFRVAQVHGCKRAVVTILANNAAGLGARHNVPFRDLFKSQLWVRVPSNSLAGCRG